MTEGATTQEFTVAERLAGAILGVSSKTLTRFARTRALIGIADTVGVTLAGSGEPAVQKLKSVLGAAAGGPVTVIGGPEKISALDAALINGTAGHALDYDDFSSAFGGHQSVTLVAALFALAESEGASGEEIVTAYAAGVEAEIRLARAVHFHHYDKGWHPTATLGAIAAAGACCHLIKLDRVTTAQALALAASQAAGIKANFGTMTKPLHVGIANRAGLMSALLAREGFTANTAAFEHAQGFFEVYNGADNYQPEKLFENWMNPAELEDEGLALKLWPCCGSTHAAIAAALALRKAEVLTVDRIDRIEVLPHARRLKHTDTPRPVTPLQAKFSVQYVVARALADGNVTLAHFEPAAVTDPAITALLERTEAKGHPDMAEDAASQWAAEVIVKTTDGKTLSYRIADFMAEGGAMPASVGRLWDKFEDCAARALPHDRIAPLFDMLETLDDLDDITRLTRLLSGTPPAPKERAQAGRPEDNEHHAETNWVP